MNALGKTVRVCRLNDTPTDYVGFPDAATVDDVLKHFNITLTKGEQLAIDGDNVEGDYDDFGEDTTIYIIPSTSGA